jgi:predicted kinase
VDETPGSATGRPEKGRVNLQKYPMVVTVVMGPPLAGKTTYVHAHAKAGDLIVDLDYLWAALSLSGVHMDHQNNRIFAWEARDAIIQQIGQGSNIPDHAAWVIGGFANKSSREATFQYLRPKRVIVLETSAKECRSRIAADPRPINVMQMAIMKWWDKWDRSVENAEIISA